jgi:hypothetical protein
MTEKGRQAQQILRWVFADPDHRARWGQEQLNALADGATGQELIEVQDAGTSVSRLLAA